MIVSGLTFRSLIHFEFIFVYGVRECSNFILLHVAVQFFWYWAAWAACIFYLYFINPLSVASFANIKYWFLKWSYKRLVSLAAFKVWSHEIIPWGIITKSVPNFFCPQPFLEKKEENNFVSCILWVFKISQFLFCFYLVKAKLEKQTGIL